MIFTNIKQAIQQDFVKLNQDLTSNLFYANRSIGEKKYSYLTPHNVEIIVTYSPSGGEMAGNVVTEAINIPGHIESAIDMGGDVIDGIADLINGTPPGGFGSGYYGWYVKFVGNRPMNQQDFSRFNKLQLLDLQVLWGKLDLNLYPQAVADVSRAMAQNEQRLGAMTAQTRAQLDAPVYGTDYGEAQRQQIEAREAQTSAQLDAPVYGADYGEAQRQEIEERTSSPVKTLIGIGIGLKALSLLS